MKNKILQKRILSGVLGTCFACMSFVATGCFPFIFGDPQVAYADDGITDDDNDDEDDDDNDDEDDDDNDDEDDDDNDDEDFEIKEAEISGIKVLRRPTSYEYEKNTDRDDEITDYYQGISKDFFYRIERVYGIVNGDVSDYNDTYFKTIEENNKDNENIQTIANMMKNSRDELKYFYDAIRYQVTDVEEWVKYKDPSREDTKKEDDIDTSLVASTYYKVTADTNKGWNWIQNYEKFGYNQTDIEVLVYSDKLTDAVGNFNNGKLTNCFKKFDLDLFNNGLDGYYSEIINSSTYQNIFSSESYNGDASLVSNENMNFIYTLTYAIYNIVLGLDIADAGWQGTGANNEWIVEGYEDYEAKGYSSSSEYAMKAAKEKFEKLGSYVGLTASDKEKIKNYILNEVIGENALNYGIQDLYYEDVVNAFFDHVVTFTKTGSAGGSTTVGDAFIASEIIDYPKTNFFACDGDDQFANIKSCEYQSILIMPSEEIKNLGDIWLDFKYIAKNKNLEPLEDKNLSITIEVDIRWFDGTTLRTLSALGRSKTITVYNDSYDPGKDNSHMEFNLDSTEDGVEEGFGKDLEINLAPIVCDALDAEKYNATLPETKKQIDELTSFKKIILDKNANARHYYEVVNSGSFGAYGVLSNDKMKNAGVGSYLEIAFDIKKEVGNVDKNYDFYVCISSSALSDKNDPTNYK